MRRRLVAHLCSVEPRCLAARPCLVAHPHLPVATHHRQVATAQPDG
jgi:hypothetical protein